jgi:hypothetical protein
MPEKNGKRDTQKTEQGYEIPVPKRKDVLGMFDKAAKKRSPEKPSPPSKGKRRTSRDDQ